MAAHASPVFHFNLRQLLNEVREDATVLEQPALAYFKEFLTEWVAKQHDASAATSNPTHEVPAVAPRSPRRRGPVAASTKTPAKTTTVAEEAQASAHEPVPQSESAPQAATASHEEPARRGEVGEGDDCVTPDPDPGPVDLDTRGDDADEEALAESQAKAAEALSAGRYAAACAHFTACVDAGPPSALMLARRAECLVRLSKPVAALRDCDAALALNPDNGKAYKIRGWAYRTLGQWDSALKDLVTGQGIDYDESMRAMQLLVQSKVDEKRAEGARAQAERAEAAAKERREQREREREREEERRRTEQREQAQARQREEQEERKRRDSQHSQPASPRKPKPLTIPSHLVRKISDDPDLRKVFGTPKLMAIVAEVCTYTFPSKGFQHEVD